MTSRARAYTAKQRTAALALVRAGSLITAASRATGVSRWTLLAWCRRAGVQTVPRLAHGPEVRAEVRALRKAGLTISAIHRATGVGRDTIALWTGPGRPGRPRSAAGPQVVGLRRAGVGIAAKVQEVAMRVLTPREYYVIMLRYGLDGEGERTLEEVGAQLDITRERVRQIERDALTQLVWKVDPSWLDESSGATP